MNIVVHAKNIKWDTDGEPVKGLPKKIDVKMETGTAEDIESFVADNLADKLSDRYGYCVNGCDFEWEEDLGAAVRTLKRILSKRLKRIKDFEESYDFENLGRTDWEAEQKKFRKDFDELLRLGIQISRNQINNRIMALGLEVRK